MSDLHDRISKKDPIDAIAAYLDQLPAPARQAAVQGLPAGDLKVLYSLAEGRHAELEFFVPEGVAAGNEVVHHGRNSLPVIGGTFRKRFTRIAGDETLLTGFNDNDGFVAKIGWFTGPGYFVVRPRGCAHPDGRTDTEQLFVNYYETPTGAAPVPGWPAPMRNNGLTRGASFGDMCDYMWRVSAHVSIGEAWKKGRNVKQYFALVRDDS